MITFKQLLQSITPHISCCSSADFLSVQDPALVPEHKTYLPKVVMPNKQMTISVIVWFLSVANRDSLVFSSLVLVT